LKVCVVGAGAIGGLIGTRLALRGRCEVAALARGATLQALQTRGWRLRMGDALLQSPAQAAADPATLGVQDLLVVSVKAQHLPVLAPGLRPLIGPHTLVWTAMNGVPWWFCAGLPGWEQRPLRSVDPTGSIASALPIPQILGGVVHASASVLEPGLVAHRMGQGLIVGSPSFTPADGPSLAAERVASLLRDAGFEASASADIRRDIWFKLWGNLTMNPVSALTGATADRVLADPLVRAFISSAMAEAAAIGARIGCPIEQTAEQRHAVTSRLGAFKTSMLQDVQAGRPIELNALVGAVHEIARHLALPTPCIDALLGLTRLFAQGKGLLPPT
jgi:2-dehydropantoate 2-reductase